MKRPVLLLLFFILSIQVTKATHLVTKLLYQDSIPTLIIESDTICIFNSKTYIETCATIEHIGQSVLKFAGQELSGSGYYFLDTIFDIKEEIMEITKCHVPKEFEKLLNGDDPDIVELTRQIKSKESLFIKPKANIEKIDINFENFHNGFSLIINEKNAENVKKDAEAIRIMWISPNTRTIHLNRSFLRRGMNQLTRSDTNTIILIEII